MDGENPRTFTAKPRSQTMSGGTICVISGTTGDVGSTASSVLSSDFEIINAVDNTLFNGIVLQNAGSNVYTTVATKGCYLMRAAGVISGGALVNHNASGGVISWYGSISGTAVINETIIGRAMSSSASGTDNYVLVSLL